jgi:hypothetical protein
MALTFELVLHQLRVAVRADRNQRRPRKKMNLVVEPAWQRKPGRCDEDVIELFQ